MIKYIYLLPTLVIFLWGCSAKEKKEGDQTPIKPIEPDKVIGIGRIEPEAKLTDLYSEVSGIIDEVKVKEGDTVKKDDILISLTNATESSQLMQAKSKIQTQRAQVNAARAFYNSLRVKEDNLKTRLERIKNMFNAGAETRQNMDNAQADFENARDIVLQAEASLLSSEGRLKELDADVNYYNVQLERRFIKAPSNGKILSLDLQIGELAGQNNSLGQFAPAGPTIALCEIDELFAQLIRKGQRAYIRSQGQTDTLADGEILYAAPSLKKKSLFSDQVSDLEDRRVREIKVLIDSSFTTLLYGSRVECVVEIK